MNWSRFFNQFSARRVDVYADFIDPFSYIGFHNLWKAARTPNVKLVWKGFEFNPDTPHEGSFLIAQPNSDVKNGMWASVRDFGRRSGIEMAEPEFVYNTSRAQALAHALPVSAETNEFLLAIFAAYFEEGKDIYQASVLKSALSRFPTLAPIAERYLSGQPDLNVLASNRRSAEERKFPGLPGFVHGGNNYFGALPASAWESVFTANKGIRRRYVQSDATNARDAEKGERAAEAARSD